MMPDLGVWLALTIGDDPVSCHGVPPVTVSVKSMAAEELRHQAGDGRL